MSVQSTPRKSTSRQASVARRLNADSSSKAIARMMDSTVEFLNDEHLVIEKVGRISTVWYVKSCNQYFSSRYYVVIWNTDRHAYECSCGAMCNGCKHTRRVSGFNAVRMASVC